MIKDCPICSGRGRIYLGIGDASTPCDFCNGVGRVLTISDMTVKEARKVLDYPAGVSGYPVMALEQMIALEPAAVLVLVAQAALEAQEKPK